LQVADPKLARGRDGIWRPGSDSPAIGAGAGEFAAVPTDFEGQPRGRKKDVGCDQVSTEPVEARLLTVADVGPTWIKHAFRSRE
jgi:poly(beta-D-mannuronate) lyase